MTLAPTQAISLSLSELRRHRERLTRRATILLVLAGWFVVIGVIDWLFVSSTLGAIEAGVMWGLALVLVWTARLCWRVRREVLEVEARVRTWDQSDNWRWQ